MSGFRVRMSLENYDVVEQHFDPGRDLPGKITFDSRGNARYLWRDSSMLEEGDEGTARRLRALSVAHLELAEHAQTAAENKISVNKTGRLFGYNPYDSGVLLRA